MKKIDSELSFSITKAITDIPKQDWDDLFGRELIESYGYLKTMEENGVEKFSFRYLLGKRGGRTVFILPLFIVDFSFTMLVPEYFYRIARKFSRWLSMKVLFLGSPTTEGFSMGFTDDENFDAILDQALKKLTAYSKEEKIKGILFYNLSPKHGRLAGYLKKKKFLKMETLPTTIINIKTNSLEEYIADLGKNTRKDLKKKLRRSQGLAQLKTELREDITDIIDEIYKLYLNNFNDADVHFEILTKEFFLNICRNMPGVAKYFITYDKGKIIAFNLCLLKNRVFIDKFIGFDYTVAHKYHLYYTTFCHNIEWCIKHAFSVYQPGFSDYHPKIRLGAKLIPLDIYAKAYNPLLNSIIRLIKPLIEPKNIDSTLKEIEKQKGRANLMVTNLPA